VDEEKNYTSNEIQIRKRKNYLTKDDLEELNKHITKTLESKYCLSSFSNNEIIDFLFKEKIDKFFSEKFAYQALISEKDFEDLHHYLQECYNCLKANLEIAGAIMIRPCIQMFLKFYNKENQEKKEEKIVDNFIKEIDSDNSLAILKNRKIEIKKFFTLCINNANHVAHLRYKSAKKYIDEYSVEDSLKLLCLIIKSTILKDLIEKIKQQEQQKKFNEIKFDHKKQSSQTLKNIDQIVD
jgi:hypothetical protein